MTDAVSDVTALLDELERLQAAATDAEWENVGRYRIDAEGDVIARVDHPADAALIVAAVNALPELLQLVRERYTLEAAVLALAERFDDEARDALRDSETFYDQEKWAAAKRCGSEARMAASHATDLRSTVTAALAGQHTTDEGADRG